MLDGRLAVKGTSVGNLEGLDVNLSPAAGRPLVTARWRSLVWARRVLALVLLTVAVAGIGLGEAASAALVTADSDPAVAFTALQVAVLDRLNRSEDDDPTRAGLAYKQLAGHLADLSAQSRGRDDVHRRLEEARQRLEVYWQGFQRVLDLRRVRDRLNEETLRGISVDFRLTLQRIMATGQTAEAGVAGDAVISMLLVQQHVDHLIGYHDPLDAGRARLELEAARHRIEELGRMLIDAGTRVTVGTAGALLGSYATAFDQLVPAVEAEQALLAEAVQRGGDELATMLAEMSTGARPSSPLSPWPLSPSPSVQPKPESPAAPALVAPSPPSATAPEAPSVGDFRLPVIVTVVALVAPLLGILIGWRLGSRQRQDTVAPTAPPEAGEAEFHPPAAPPQTPVPMESTVPGIEVGADWLVGMGRMVAMLNNTGTDVAVLQEHTERVRAELAAAKERAEAANRAMSSFLAGLGDQLEGPLALIVRMGDQLMVELDRRGMHQLTSNVELIQWSGEQLLRTIEGLRAMVEIETNTMVVVPKDFLVEHLIAEVRERVRPLTVLFGNHLTIQAAPGIGRMRSDFPKVRAALLHIMENACKFAENGDVMLLVMRVEEGGRSIVRFTVTDTGVGIPQQHIDDIFEPFVGFGPARARGAGLGLARVHHYEVRLGGSIVVDSTLGRGSCFVLTLPAELDPEAPKVADEAPVLKLSARASGGTATVSAT